MMPRRYDFRVLLAELIQLVQQARMRVAAGQEAHHGELAGCRLAHNRGGFLDLLGQLFKLVFPVAELPGEGI